MPKRQMQITTQTIDQKKNDAFNDKYIEYKSKGDVKLSMKQYLEMIRPYLDDTKEKRKKSNGWKIQLMNIKFISSKDGDGKQ